MITDYENVKPLFDAAAYTPIGFGKPINERLAEHPDGRKWQRRVAMSAWEIIRDNFEDDHCRSFMLWMAFQTVVPPEWPMTGRLAYSLVCGRQRWSWCVPKGGSGAFTDALVRLIEAHDGAALTGKPIERLIVDNGRCMGVECADGSSYRAAKAVLSTIHIKHLVGMAPRELWDDDFVDGVATWQGGPTLFVTHYATSEPMRFAIDGGTVAPIAAAMLSTPTRALRMGYDFACGVANTEEPVLLAVCPTIADAYAGAVRTPHAESPRHATLRPQGRAGALGHDQGPGVRGQFELAAAFRHQFDRRQDSCPRGRKPARPRAQEPA